MWIGPAQGDRAGVLRGFIQDTASELPRIPILGRWVNKDHHVRLRLLVNDEHVRDKLIRCGPDTGLGVQILRPTLFELLAKLLKLLIGTASGKLSTSSESSCPNLKCATCKERRGPNNWSPSLVQPCLVVLPWRLVARRVRRYGRNTVRVPVRRVAATVFLARRDRRERHTGERHRQRHHDRRHQHQYALSHRFSPPIPWSASTDLFRHRTIHHPA